MDAYDINGVQVSDVAGSNPAGLPTVSKLVTFYVGKNGPFFLRYTPAEYSASQVLDDMRKEAETLRVIGATS
jgi:hypothetical protein